MLCIQQNTLWPYSLSFRYFFFAFFFSLSYSYFVCFCCCTCMCGGDSFTFRCVIGGMLWCGMVIMCVRPLSSDLTSKNGTNRTKEIRPTLVELDLFERPRRRRWLRWQQLNLQMVLKSVWAIFPSFLLHTFSPPISSSLDYFRRYTLSVVVVVVLTLCNIAIKIKYNHSYYMQIFRTKLACSTPASHFEDRSSIHLPFSDAKMRTEMK